MSPPSWSPVVTVGRGRGEKQGEGTLGSAHLPPMLRNNAFLFFEGWEATIRGSEREMTRSSPQMGFSNNVSNLGFHVFPVCMCASPNVQCLGGIYIRNKARSSDQIKIRLLIRALIHSAWCPYDKSRLGRGRTRKKNL